MGNQESSNERPDSDDKHSSINHPKMKNIKFVQNDEVIRASINVENQDQFNKWEENLAKLRNFDEYYLLLPKAYSFVRKAVCGSSGIIQIDFDNYPYLLNEQLDNRRKENNYFTETELWYLLYGLLCAANILRKADIKVGDIQPKNIFINPEGQIKVSNLCSWPSQRSNYQKLVVDNVLGYVSPQQFMLSRQGKIDIYSKMMNKNPCDKYLCESFSIGLTILQASALVDNSQLYNNKQKQFNSAQLAKRVSKILTNNNGLTKYSKSLRIAIAGLCQVKPQQRLAALDLYSTLRSNDSELSNLKQCSVQIASVKNRNKYQQMIVMGQQKVNSHPTVPNIINKQPNNKINSNTYISSQPIGSSNPIGSNNLPNNYYANTAYTNTLYNNYSKAERLPSLNYNLANPSYHYPNAQLQNKSIPQSRPNTYYYNSAITPSYTPTFNPNLNKPVTSANIHISTSVPPLNINNFNQFKPSTQPYSSAHSYLENVYSGQASGQNPTLSQKPNYPSTINKNMWQNKSTNSTQSKYAQYSFSNISSIPKQQKQSGQKANDSINIFTPSHFLPHSKNLGLNQDSSLNLLKKINQEIAVSKQNFREK